MRYGQIMVHCFVMITYPDKISSIIFCPENRLSGKMNYGAASIRIRINKEVTRKKKKTDIYAAVSVPRKNWRPATYRNWFWHGTSVFWSGSWRRRKRQRGKKTSVSGKRIRIGSSERCPDEDLRLSNFISVQVGAGLLGIETTMLFTPISTDDC